MTAMFIELDDPAVFVYIKEGFFSWRRNVLNAKKSSDGRESVHYVLQNVNLKVRKGEIVAVCGPVGSGKTSLIYGLLGEIHCSTGRVALRSPRIAYVPQIPWIISGTIKTNILFGSPFRPEWFQEVIKACGLDVDISRFPDKEDSVLGEHGISLSGGQKARIALARAVYSDADIYLLDDPLAAIDPKVSKYIV
jgi:ATP-binding cassette subfamily C (CFTR/MRP) protein 4